MKTVIREDPTLYEKMKKYRVQASSLEDFRQRFTKPRAYAERGPDYVEAVLKSAQQDIERYGYTLISHHDSVTGEVVTYYPL
ncbi:MAG: hypothetical protein ACI3W5_13345 [Faecousia sp.]